MDAALPYLRDAAPKKYPGAGLGLQDLRLVGNHLGSMNRC